MLTHISWFLATEPRTQLPHAMSSCTAFERRPPLDQLIAAFAEVQLELRFVQSKQPVKGVIRQYDILNCSIKRLQEGKVLSRHERLKYADSILAATTLGKPVYSAIVATCSFTVGSPLRHARGITLAQAHSLSQVVSSCPKTKCTFGVSWRRASPRKALLYARHTKVC